MGTRESSGALMPEVGKGSPSYFACSACREAQGLAAAYKDRDPRSKNTRARTGRERKARGNRNIRMLGVIVEYVCTCGHVGWSKHQGVLKLPHNGEVPEGPLFLEEKARRR